MSYRVIKNAETSDIILRKAKWCASFWCHLKGLQFVRNLPEDEGLLFVTGKETRSQATIHMFFMFFSIGIVWLDSQGKVVDKKLAKPWRPAYAPSLPAQYYIEARPSVLDKVQIGDILQFDEVK
ncbi:MAG: hypothetical protein Kow00117_10460 [Phototrophicales bacterium]